MCKVHICQEPGQSRRHGLKLEALVPHQFGNHYKCQPVWCGFKRSSDTTTYQHRSLPYKASLRDPILRTKLEALFQPIINRSDQYVDLGSSQQCEHANREVTLKVPKNIHYGGSAGLDYRVQATTAFVNEGRHYLSQVSNIQYTNY